MDASQWVDRRTNLIGVFQNDRESGLETRLLADAEPRKNFAEQVVGRELAGDR